MKMLLPEDCIKSDVCKYVGDDGCWNGCDYRIEKLTSDNSECTVLEAFMLSDDIERVRRALESFYSKSGDVWVSFGRIKAALEELINSSHNTGSPKFSAESKEFIGSLLRSQVDLPPDIAEAVNDHFWELL